MNQAEANELIKLINSFVVQEGESTPMVEVIEGETEEKPKVELTEEEIQKLFRRMVPEGFSMSEASAIRSPGTGDKVFLKFGTQKWWIPDIETLEKLGIGMGDVKNLTDDEVRELKEGYNLLSVKRW